MRVHTRAAIGAALLVAAGLVGCSPRQVEVRTAPTNQASATVQVSNNLAKAVNLYATQNGTDTFLRQIGPHSSASVPVQGFAPGSSVTLKAVTIDGIDTYTKANVTLGGTYTFSLP